MRTARAKGLTERRVLVRHALRTSLITFVTLFGLDFGALVGGGALLTEVVFGLQGVGKLTYDALQNLDLPMIMATVMYASFFVVLANALVDLLYVLLDPRVRHAWPSRCSRCATSASPSAPRTASCAPSTGSRSASPPGEILGIVGESGSGKSVTAMSRHGADPRSERDHRGRAHLQGARAAGAAAARAARRPRRRTSP